VLKVLVTMSQSEQQVNINIFCKLGKSTMGTLIGLNVVYEDKALKKSFRFFHAVCNFTIHDGM
jgi:hypothetical protein